MDDALRAMTPTPPRRHLLSSDDLARPDIERLLDLAASLEAVGEREVKKLPTLRGRTVVNVFFESSTRTSSSFELAAKRLSADVMSIKAAGSSTDKGESLKDTILTLDAYEPDVLVIRHPQIGRRALRHAAHPRVGDQRRRRQASAPDPGAARPVHDPQGGGPARGPARRDRRRRPALAGRALEHDRFARCGMRVTLVGPPRLIPREIAASGVEVSHDVDAIAAADVVYVLRMQRERMLAGEAFVPSLREYAQRYCVTPARVRPGQIVMHPGPMNRGVEIDGVVADSAASLIAEQVRSGLVVRMAVLYDVLLGSSVPAPLAAVREAVA